MKLRGPRRGRRRPASPSPAARSGPSRRGRPRGWSRARAPPSLTTSAHELVQIGMAGQLDQRPAGVVAAGRQSSSPRRGGCRAGRCRSRRSPARPRPCRRARPRGGAARDRARLERCLLAAANASIDRGLHAADRAVQRLRQRRQLAVVGDRASEAAQRAAGCRQPPRRASAPRRRAPTITATDDRHTRCARLDPRRAAAPHASRVQRLLVELVADAAHRMDELGIGRRRARPAGAGGARARRRCAARRRCRCPRPDRGSSGGRRRGSGCARRTCSSSNSRRLSSSGLPSSHASWLSKSMRRRPRS